MTEGRVERRLAAILAADVAGYSRLMGTDEIGTLTALKTIRREIFDPAIAGHRGRIVKTTGDGLLVEFASAVDAVTCAMAVQETMAGRKDTTSSITFRIGINVGDVIIDGDDIFGDGVNVAARVEGECEPGGVYLAANAFEQIRGKTQFTFDDLGERALKNIERPVRIYAVKSQDLFETIAPVAMTSASDAKKPLPLPDKPSIAVLPFQNMSGDPEQEYFTDGMVEDIITALSRFKSLFVIARNSSFTYKGKAVDIKQVGRELGVRYVLEGSVRKFGQQVRITGQLVEASTGAHLWADKIDQPIHNIFELQDNVTAVVVAAIDPSVQRAEIERAARKPTERLDAFECYHRGMQSFRQMTSEGNIEAERHFRRAIDLDPNFATAYGQIAGCFRTRLLFGWMGLDRGGAIEGRPYAMRAIELGQDDAVALACAALFLAYVTEEYQLAVAIVDQAVRINPNLFQARQVRSLINVWLGHHELAIRQAHEDLRLNPLDPDVRNTHATLAWAFLFLGRLDDAMTFAARWLAASPNHAAAIRTSIVIHVLAGRMDQATSLCLHLRQLDPNGTLSRLRPTLPFQQPQDASLFLEGLRQAGMPE